MSIHMFTYKVLLFTQNNILIAGVMSNYVWLKFHLCSVHRRENGKSATPLPMRIKTSNENQVFLLKGITESEFFQTVDLF